MELFGKPTTHMKNAGRLAGRALAHGRELIKEGALLLDVANSVEEFIVKEGGSVAFPVNLAINSVAAHYTPDHQDKTRFERGDVVKLDVGAHERGYIGDTALTVEVTTHQHQSMVKASREALNAAIEMMRPGVDLSMVGSRVEETIRSFGFQPIRNLTGHSMERYNLHAGLSVPSVKERVKAEVKPGQLIAIEPFATDGAGKVDGHKKSNIYRLHREGAQLKGPAEELVKLVNKEYRTLPFSERWAAGKISRPAPVLQQLVRQRAITSYPILVDVKGGTVTQAEHTVLITEDGCEVLTRI
jgi:methionyl aminopeptidase